MKPIIHIDLAKTIKKQTSTLVSFELETRLQVFMLEIGGGGGVHVKQVPSYALSQYMKCVQDLHPCQWHGFVLLYILTTTLHIGLVLNWAYYHFNFFSHMVSSNTHNVRMLGLNVKAHNVKVQVHFSNSSWQGPFIEKFL